LHRAAPEEAMPVLRLNAVCNLRCISCGEACVSPAGVVADLAAVRRRLATLGPDETLEVAGGEPTLSPLLPALLVEAKRAGRNIRLRTNAMRAADPAIANALIRAGLADAVVALFGPDAETHDALTRTPGSFALTTQGARRLLDGGVQVSFEAPLVAANVRRLRETFRFIRRDFGAAAPVRIVIPGPQSGAWGDPALTPRLDDLRQEFAFGLDYGSRIGLRLAVADPEGAPFCVLGDFARLSERRAEIGRAHV